MCSPRVTAIIWFLRSYASDQPAAAAAPSTHATIAAVPTPRTIQVTRYVTPLREGGSLPAIVEADDDGMYVLKFRGAGQGPRALIAELGLGRDRAGARPAGARSWSSPSSIPSWRAPSPIPRSTP